MKKLIWKTDTKFKMLLPECFMPDQVINMGEGNYKRIDEVELDESVLVYDEENDEFKEGKVNSIMKRLHDDCYELTLESGQTLKPTGNHPFLLKDKGWSTIDGHNPNHVGGNGVVEVGDYVRDLDGWVEITEIKKIKGEHETYNLVNQDYKTIIAHDIVTHNSAVVSGTEELIEMKVQEKSGEINILEVKVGDIIASALIDTEEIIYTQVSSINTESNTGGIILKVSTDDNHILYTSTHLIPFYRGGVLLEDNLGTLQVGDEVIVNDNGFTKKPIVSIEEIKPLESGVDVIHPHTLAGYHFVNNILVEG